MVTCEREELGNYRHRALSTEGPFVDFVDVRFLAIDEFDSHGGSMYSIVALQRVGKSFVCTSNQGTLSWNQRDKKAYRT